MKKKNLFLGVLLASAVFTLAACNNKANNTESGEKTTESPTPTGDTPTESTTGETTPTGQGDTKYSVKFMDGTTEVSSVEVAQGGKVTKPATNPTKAEDNNNTYEFVTWCKDSALTTEFNFETETISAATTIYAKFAAVSKDTAIKMNGTEYATLAEAFAAIPATSTDTFVITIPKGNYSAEGLSYNGSATIKIKGNTTAKYGADVVITGHGSDMGQEKTRNLIEIQGTGNIILENITLVSDWTRDGAGKKDVQSEVLGTDTTGNTIAYNCGFKSHQDTLRTVGKAWFYGCYIEGDVDFIWMEKAGIVALYEKCEIVSVYDSSTFASHETIVAAPRMSINSKVGKGLVIYNSTVKESDEAKANGQKTYLARSLGSSGCYDQVAYINTTCTDVEASVFKNSQFETDYPKTVIGWKMDKATAASLNYEGNDNILDDDTVSKEFGGRKAILNRIYNTGKLKYEKDEVNLWDIDAVISDNNFLVDADTSSNTLDGEVVGETTIYKFDGTEDQSSLCDGFAKENADDKPHYVGNSGATITIPVSGKCYVEVYGYHSGTVEATTGSQGAGIMFFNNGTTSSELSDTYIVYDESATSVVITAKAKTYIRKIVVTKDSTIKETKATSIDISASTNNFIVGVDCKLTAKVSSGETTNKSVKWKSNDESIATIDEYNGKVSFKAAGTASFTVTACDGSNVTKDFTCEVEDANWTAAEWYTTDNLNADYTKEATATNIKYFSPSADQCASLVNNQTFTNLKGESITTGYGVKLNSSTDSGALKVSITGSATLTLMIAPRSGSKPTAAPKVVCGATTAELISSTTEGDITTCVYKLTEKGEWVISRGNTSTENNPIFYAKCEIDQIISEAAALTFGTDGNYGSQKAFNVTANANDNGGDNSYVYGGNIEFEVAAGAKVEVYANYTADYDINGTKVTGLVGSEGQKFYTFTEKTKVVIKCDEDSTGDNCLYWVKVTFPNA